MTFLRTNLKQERIAMVDAARRDTLFLQETGLGLECLNYPLRL